MFDLRDYQSNCIKDTVTSFETHNRIMVQSPTGSGKSVIIAELVKWAISEGYKVLFAVDRKELVSQIHQTLLRQKIIAGVIMAGVTPMYGVDVQVASIQTLNRRNKPKADLIIIDEAHGATSDSYRKLWDIYPDSKIVGFTATPYRLSGHGFSDLFDILIQTKDINELIELGYLVPIKHFACSLPDFYAVKERHGDYDDESAIDAMKTAPVVDSYLEYCEGKKGIVFAQNVKHSIEIAKQYNDSGVSAKHIDADTPSHERANTIKDFKSGKIKVLCNVALFITGLDVPDIEFVQILRMTKSLTYYLQMVGRGTRVLTGVIDNIESVDERLHAIANSNKRHCNILDHAGLFYEHGLATSKRDWQFYFERTKKDKEKKKVAKETLFLVEDENKEQRFVKTLEETKGMRLLEITDDMLLIAEFDTMLRRAIQFNHKLIAVWFKFNELLQTKKIPMSEVIFDYVQKRMTEANIQIRDETKKFKTAFFFVKRKELFPKPTQKEVLIPLYV